MTKRTEYGPELSAWVNAEMRTVFYPLRKRPYIGRSRTEYVMRRCSYSNRSECVHCRNQTVLNQLQIMNWHVTRTTYLMHVFIRAKKKTTVSKIYNGTALHPFFALRDVFIDWFVDSASHVVWKERVDLSRTTAKRLRGQRWWRQRFLPFDLSATIDH